MHNLLHYSAPVDVGIDLIVSIHIQTYVCFSLCRKDLMQEGLELW